MREAASVLCIEIVSGLYSRSICKQSFRNMGGPLINEVVQSSTIWNMSGRLISISDGKGGKYFSGMVIANVNYGGQRQ